MRDALKINAAPVERGERFRRGVIFHDDKLRFNGNYFRPEPSKAFQNCRRSGGVRDKKIDIGQRAVAGEGGLANLTVVGEDARLGSDAPHDFVDPR
jgi:hypothetical protein